MYETVITIVICGLVILLAFEMRYRKLTEDVATLKDIATRLEDVVLRLQNELRFKQDAYQEHKPNP